MTDQKAKKYRVTVKLSMFPGQKYDVFFTKRYGDRFSGSISVQSREKLLKLLRRVFDEWEGYDQILGRNGDRITPGNLELEMLTADITADDVIALIRARKRRAKGVLIEAA